MQNSFDELIQQVPSRARVGLGLASAERATAMLRGYPDLYSLAHHGLQNAWQWLGGADTSAVDLYNQIDPLAFASTDLEAGSSEQNAVLSVVSALYYATGEIATYETPQNPPQIHSALGSDMADVGSEDLAECLSRAADSAINTESEARWQQALVSRLLSNFRTDNSNQLGPPIIRGYFLT